MGLRKEGGLGWREGGRVRLRNGGGLQRIENEVGVEREERYVEGRRKARENNCVW